MDESVAVINRNMAMPFAVEDWLPSMPDGQVLVIGSNEVYAAGRLNPLIQNTRQHAGPGEQWAFLDRPTFNDFKTGDPFALPYDSGSFDLVICDFVSAGSEITRELLKEIGRVLRPDGQLLIIDYLVPGSRLRGKKAHQLRLAGEYVNTWVRLWNSQHKKYLSQDAWTQLLADAQWTIQQMTTCETEQDFDTWAESYSPNAKNRIRLQVMIVQAPEKVHRFLTPLESGDRIAFRMTEVFILAAMAMGAE